MKKVFVRFYDQENLGDDLFLRILITRYHDDFLIRKSYNAGSFTVNGKVLVAREPRCITLASRIISRILSTVLIASIPTIRKNDLMVHIGGSLFMETNGPAFWSREENFYKQLSIPYYILGSNVGPIQTSQFINSLRNIFNNAQDVCFRDRMSYEIFKDVPSTRVATDVAFALNIRPFTVTSEERSVIFSVIDTKKKFNDAIANKYDNEIIKLSRKLAMIGYRITLMSFCKHEGDEDAIERIVRKMDKEMLEKVDTYMYRGNLDEALKILAKSEMIVASRFHASILGLLFGKKVLPMAYSAKTTNILKDMNFRGPVIDINKIDDFDGSSFDFDALEINDVSDQVKLAEKQFQELDKVLTKR